MQFELLLGTVLFFYCTFLPCREKGDFCVDFLQEIKSGMVCKGQLISKGDFGVFKSTKKPTNFLEGFLTYFRNQKIGALYKAK